jgi:hypothetical protein
MQNGRELWISHIYFPMENPVDRVHGAWIGWRDSGPPWTEVTRTKGHGGALLARSTRALGLTNAHCRRWRTMSRTRRCRRGAHQSMSGGGGEAQWRRRTAVA